MVLSYFPILFLSRRYLFSIPGIFFVLGGCQTECTYIIPFSVSVTPHLARKYFAVSAYPSATACARAPSSACYYLDHGGRGHRRNQPSLASHCASLPRCLSYIIVTDVFAYRVEMSTGNQHEVATTQGSFHEPRS
jgi:hypothetical protein